MISLEGTRPDSDGIRLLQVAAYGFDVVYKMMETANSYTYEPLPANDPKRTRINKRHVAEPLYGKHLRTEALFDQYIGNMTEPLIVACNGFNDIVLHAFLVFRNSLDGKYNTLHIRQGSYYPEFMDDKETKTYFSKENKRVLAALTLEGLTGLYDKGALNLEWLKDIYKQRFQDKNTSYRICDQNCMTFSLLSLAATNLDLQHFLNRVGLDTIQSPLHILLALAGSEKNHPALYIAKHPKLGKTPLWLQGFIRVVEPGRDSAATFVPQ